MAAISTPRQMAGNALFNLMLNIAAISDPVHAPIAGNGKGIATKSISPKNKPLCSRSPIDLALFSYLSASLPRRMLFVLIQAKILRIKIIINGDGAIFPTIAAVAFGIAGRPSIAPIGIATLGPPIAGINDNRNITAHRPI